MTHLDVYRCDRKRCQEEKPAKYDTQEAVLPILPMGWIELAKGTNSKHFCSLDCLAIWARAERAAKEGT